MTVQHQYSEFPSVEPDSISPSVMSDRYRDVDWSDCKQAKQPNLNLDLLKLYIFHIYFFK